MYKLFIKRTLDIILSLFMLLILSPFLLVFTIIGIFAMRGNPFFLQKRPGKINKKTGKEKIFTLIKFRTMSNKKDKEGNLLPDIDRLNFYGKLLRKTSIDELPELFNILKGDMSFIGPRPLAVSYLPYYTDEERKRHTIRPGLTGLAQVSGRNNVNWEERFAYDIQYLNNLSFLNDIKIIIKTIKKVLGCSDVVVAGTTDIIDFDAYRKKQLENNKGKC